MHHFKLFVAGMRVETDGVIKAREQDVDDGGGDAVVKVQGGAHVAVILFDVPDGLTRAAFHAKDGDIIDVDEGIVTRDKREQRGLARAVRSRDEVMLTAVHFKGEVPEDGPFIGDVDIF